jgi:hypothetical protein
MITKPGKIVKANSKQFSKLQMQDYRWMHLRESDLVLPDNPEQSIILEKYHDPAELAQRIQNAENINSSLGTPKEPLWPIDLTQDYILDQKEIAKRKKRTRMDEEEIVSMELANFDAEHGEKEKVHWSGKSGGRASESNLNKAKVSHQTPEVAKNVAEKAVTSQPNKPDMPLPAQNLEKKEETPSPNWHELVQKAREEGYQKGMQDQQKNTPIPISPEEIEEQAEELAQHKFSDLKQQWDLDSSRLIEEQVSEKLKFNLEKQEEMLAESVLEIQKLKTEILEFGKEIFMEFIKVSSEKILKNQLLYSDESLISIYEECMGQLKKGSKTKLTASKAIVTRLESVLDESQKEGVTFAVSTDDHSVQLTVESDQLVAQFNLKDQVEKLVNHVIDENIFDKQSKSA